MRTGQWIVTERGRVGMIDHISRRKNLVVCRFGPDGPFATFAVHNLRYATYDDVKAAGYEGVGGEVMEGPIL